MGKEGNIGNYHTSLVGSFYSVLFLRTEAEFSSAKDYLWMELMEDKL